MGKKLNTGIVIVSILILLSLITIVLLLAFKPDVPESVVPVEFTYIDCGEISDTVLSKGPDDLNTYLADNPEEHVKLDCATNNLKSCEPLKFLITENSNRIFTSTPKNELCLIRFDIVDDVSVECEYTKEQIRLSHGIAMNEGNELLFGIGMAFAMEFQIIGRNLAVLLNEAIEEAYERTGRIGTLTTNDFNAPMYNITFNNPETGKKEDVPCKVF